MEILIFEIFAAPVLALFFGVYSTKPSKRVWLERIRAALRLQLMVLSPALWLWLADDSAQLDCCGTSAHLSPPHRLTAYALIVCVWIAYVYLLQRKRPGPPLLELVANTTLCLGFWFNCAVFWQVGHFFHAADARSDGEPMMAALGSLPIAALLLIQLRVSHVQQLERLGELPESSPKWVNALQRLLAWPYWARFGLLSILAVPLLALLSAVLVLLGQRPDSVVRVFSDTYFHGLSQLTADCTDVSCPGHYLCTIAARGHRRWVGTFRYGRRGRELIACNRQLLVANAFEQIVEERCPALHRFIRPRYDAVGRLLSRQRRWIANPWVADLVYLAMKPLELLFLLVIYLHDVEPERRIARQYPL